VNASASRGPFERLSIERMVGSVPPLVITRNGRGTPSRRGAPKIEPSMSTPARTDGSTRISAAEVEPPSECPIAAMRPRSARGPGPIASSRRRTSRMSASRVALAAAIGSLPNAPGS
jgi:hypothetical protein